MPLPSATVAVFDRDVRSKLRTPWPYIETLADPLTLLVLFGPLVAALGGFPGMPEGETLQWFVPGILVLMVLYLSLFIGAGIQEERAAGSLERMLVTPVPRSALLLGRSLRVTVITLVASLIVVTATMAFGLRVAPGPLALAVLLLAATGAALGLGSLALGLAVKDAYAMWGVLSLILMPVMITSGAFLPMQVAPDWLYALSRINPAAHIVDAQRALFSGVVADPSVPVAFGLVLAVGLIATALGTRLLRRLRI